MSSEKGAGFIERTYRTMMWVGPLLALYSYGWFGERAMLGVATGVAISLISLASISFGVRSTYRRRTAPIRRWKARFVNAGKWVLVLAMLAGAVVTGDAHVIFGMVAGLITLHMVMLLKALTIAFALPVAAATSAR
jgi:hypothetical protein